MPKVYVGMSADIIHHGHINILNTASGYGNVIVGLLTDKAIESYKRTPIVTYNNRLQIIKNMKGVNNVIPQETLDYTDNLKKNLRKRTKKDDAHIFWDRNDDTKIIKSKHLTFGMQNDHLSNYF